MKIYLKFFENFQKKSLVDADDQPSRGIRWSPGSKWKVVRIKSVQNKK